MTYEYVAVVTPPNFRVTWATSWGRLQGHVDFIENWKTLAVSTTDGLLKLQFASCVIRQTRSLGVLVLCSNWDMVLNYIYDMVVDTQFHKFYSRSFARALYLFLMKDIGQWLPWGLPGSTGRLKKDDVVHYRSAHGYYMTRMKGGVRYAWYGCYMLTRIQQNWGKTAIHKIRELGLVTFHVKDIWVMRRAKSMYVPVYDVRTQNFRYVVFPVNVTAGHSRGPAQACSSG